MDHVHELPKPIRRRYLDLAGEYSDESQRLRGQADAMTKQAKALFRQSDLLAERARLLMDLVNESNESQEKRLTEAGAFDQNPPHEERQAPDTR